MGNIHPFMLLALVLLVAGAITQVPRLGSAPEVRHAEAAVAAAPVEAAPAEAVVPQETAVATPDEAIPTRPKRPTAGQAVATLFSDLGQAHPMPPSFLPANDPGHLRPMPPYVLNHDPGHLRPVPSFALSPVALQAEPQPAVPSAVAVETDTFVDADSKLYAKEGARLRAAPSTEADVVTTLAADAPLRAVARSSDGAWWRVSLDAPADGVARIAYVHKVAVSKNRVVASKPSPTPAPVVTATSPNSVPASRDPDLLGYVDETMDWLADTAGRGSAPAAVRTER